MLKIEQETNTCEKSDLLRQKEKDYREFSQSLSLSNSIEIKKNFFTNLVIAHQRNKIFV